MYDKRGSMSESMILDENLSARSKMLYLWLKAQEGSNRSITTTTNQISLVFGRSKQTVMRWLNELEVAGYISREYIYKPDLITGEETKEILYRTITLND